MKNNVIKENDKIMPGDIRCILKLGFFSFVILGMLFVFIGELCSLMPFDSVLWDKFQYLVLTIMELSTICLIPFALKMFKIKPICNDIKKRGWTAYCRYALFRLCLIGIPMVLNVFFYYQFLAVAFAYLAIIGAICLAFVYPSEGKCLNEIQCE